jgi:hypothetical protein
MVYNLSREANSTPSCVKPYRISPARYGKPIHFLRHHSVSPLEEMPVSNASPEVAHYGNVAAPSLARGREARPLKEIAGWVESFDRLKIDLRELKGQEKKHARKKN